jgi:hypothetical protein
LLKELRKIFDSIEGTEMVALLNEKELESWYLVAKWVVGESERERLNSTANKFGVDVLESNGYTMFHRLSQKP